jgi:hypothetical protein
VGDRWLGFWYDTSMFRTRDFLLFLIAITFLVLAIIFTLLLTDYSQVGPGLTIDTEFDTTTATITAEVVSTAVAREDRLASMRRKLSEISAEFRSPAPEPTPEEVTVNEEEEEVVPVATVDVCATQRTQTIVWSSEPQQSVIRDGVRVFYTVSTPTFVGTTTVGTSSEKILLSLPVRTDALSFTSCIPSSVVAVTPTGMPIKNSDYALYQGLGEGTLIGYTLDGFELYGRTSSFDTDACGGAVIEGVYRYYLSADRPGVIGCFAGIPVVL